MKILHLIGGDLGGGAARGAYWLHQGLLRRGVESRILTNSRETLGDENVVSIAATKKQKLISLFRAEFDNCLASFYLNRKKVIFSSGLVGFDFTKHPLYDWADIIHLHWVNAGFVDIKNLAKVKKPVVWTMRDMWPMTGGCHVAAALGCDGYKSGCGCCVQLGSGSKFDLSRLIWSRKCKFLPNHIKIVGISRWLSQCATESALFREFDVRMIHNNINTCVFTPIEKKTARQILGIDTDKKILLAGATGLGDFYKGFEKYREALKGVDLDSYYLVFFGKVEKSILDSLGFEYSSFGYLHDIISLRLVYSCADVFVAPSIMDAFGKTLVEAMSCATPVVCFDATGPADIVDHKVNGYKADPFDIVDFAKGIRWVCHQEGSVLTKAAREKVKLFFDSSVISDKYIKLYDEIN